MNTIKLQQRGLLTLPKKLRDSLGLEEGQVLRVSESKGRIVLEPQMSEHDKQLARDIKQSLDDLKNGRYFTFSTIEEFDERMKRHEN